MCARNGDISRARFQPHIHARTQKKGEEGKTPCLLYSTLWIVQQQNPQWMCKVSEKNMYKKENSIKTTKPLTILNSIQP